MEGNIGNVGKYALDLKDGKFTGSVKVSTPEGSAIQVSDDLEISIPLAAVLKPVLEALKEKIPGKFDDLVIDEVEKLLGA